MNSMWDTILKNQEPLSSKEKIMKCEKLANIIDMLSNGDQDINTHVYKLIDIELEQEYSKGYTQANADRNQNESVWSKYEDFY